MAVGHQEFTQKKPDQLVYLELGIGNGGMLLSISEEGFRFRAVNAVREAGTIPFAFSLDGRNRLEGGGTVEWVEEDGKSGGMRFTDVSAEFRAALSQWLSADVSHYPGREATPAAATPLDTMEKIRQELRAGYPTRPAEVNKVPERKPAPQAAAQSGSETKSFEKQGAGKSPAEKIPDAPKASRANLEPAPGKSSERKDQRPPQWPAPFSPGKQREPEKPASVSSAFLKPPSAAKPASAAKTPVKPPATKEPDFPPAAVTQDSPVFSSTSLLFGHSTENRPAETTRPFIPPLEESFEHAWEQARLTAPPESPHLSRAAAGSIIAIALLVILGALAYNFRQDIGSIFIQLGQSISGENRAAAPAASPEGQADTSASQANLEAAKPATSQRAAAPPATSPLQNTPAESGNGVNPAAGTNSDTPAPTAAAPPETPGTKSGRTEPSATKPAGNSASGVLTSPDAAAKNGTTIDIGSGEEEFVAAREILRGGNRQRDLPRAVELLWASVKRGYVPAEVTLADLYRRGDGVERNCAQARVLLVAASRKGSLDGREMLQKLLSQGCG
jgi:hypothetical protein